MLAATLESVPLTLSDDKRYSLHCKTVDSVKEAQSIYEISFQDLQKAAITAYIKNYLFEELPKTFDDISKSLKEEMQKKDFVDCESYRESRILFETVKPFFDKVDTFETQHTDTIKKESELFKSLTSFLNTVKKYVDFLDSKFLEIDKPKFDSRYFTHLPESELWAKRNKKRPYLVLVKNILRLTSDVPTNMF